MMTACQVGTSIRHTEQAAGQEATLVCCTAVRRCMVPAGPCQQAAEHGGCKRGMPRGMQQGQQQMHSDLASPAFQLCPVSAVQLLISLHN